MVTKQQELQVFDTHKTYYEILGIEPDASLEEIKKTYIKLARQYHPDLNGDGNARQMIELNQIYSILSDPVKKREYDERFAQASLYDFTKTNKKSVTTEQKPEYIKRGKIIQGKRPYLRMIMTGLTVLLIALMIYLMLYLIVKILQLNMNLPDWVFKFVPR